MTGRRVLAIVDDLMVRSRIEAAAASTGSQVEFPLDVADLEYKLRQKPDLIVVGLAATRKPWPDWISRIKAHPVAGQAPLYAFGPHTDLELRRRALEHGADRVLANSAFFLQLGRILTGDAPERDDEE